MGKKDNETVEEENREPEVLNLDDEIDAMLGMSEELPPELDTVDHDQETDENDDAGSEDGEDSGDDAEDGNDNDDDGHDDSDDESDHDDEDDSDDSDDSDAGDGDDAGDDSDDSDDSEIATLKAQIEELQQTIKAMASDAVAAPVKTPGKQESTSEAQVPADDPVKKSFLQIEETEEAFDELFKDAKSYNKHLVAVQDRVFQAAVSNIVPMINLHVQQAVALKELKDDFYAKNEDLTNFRELVALNINKVAAEDPKQSLDKVLAAAGERTRKMVNLPSPGAQTPETKPKPTPRKAALPNGSTRKGTPRQRPKPSGLSSEIDDMLDSI